MGRQTPQRGPGSNQWQDKPPVAPRDPVGDVTTNPYLAGDPFADEPEVRSERLRAHLDRLDEQQSAAVHHPVDGTAVVVEARAGSGKTEVLTSRYALLVDQGVDQDRIALLTFTNKAGNEMAERAGTLVDGFDPGTAVGTFHSLGARLIDERPEWFGRRDGWGVYDDDQQKALLKQVLADHDDCDLRPRAAAEAISAAKVGGRNPSDFDPDDPDQAALRAVWEDYEQRMEAANVVDYDDLICLPARAAELDPAYGRDLGRRFDHVLVDEFQDVNAAQLALVDALSSHGERARVFAVGDPRQSIYGFRHADPEAMAGLSDRYAATDYELTTNYRSTQPVCAATDVIIDPDGLHVPTVGGRDGDHPVRVLAAFDETEQAAAVADWAAADTESVAVLARTNHELREVQDQLEARGVPYVLREGIGKSKAEAAALDVLRSNSNPYDDLATESVLLNAPGIGRGSVSKLRDHAAEHGMPLRDAMRDPEAAGLSGATRNRVAELEERLGQFRSMDDDEVIRTALSDGLLGKVTGSDESAVGNLANVAAAHEDTTADFLRSSALSSAGESDEVTGMVNLSTVHAAKGLGFDRVAVIGADDHSFGAGATPAEAAEEQRVAYVAASRARDELVVAHSDTRTVFGRPVQSPRSRHMHGLEDAGAVTGDAPVTVTPVEPVQIDGKIGAVSGMRSDGRPVVTMPTALPDDVSMSPTAMDNIYRCPTKHAYASVLRVPTEPSPAAEIGKAYHSAMEQVFNLPADQRTPEAARAAAQQVLDARTAAGTVSHLGDDGPQKVHDTVAKHFDVEDPRTVRVAATEQKVTAQLPGGTRLTGTLDRLDDLGDGQFAVTDLKSGRYPSDGRKVIDQTMLYAAAKRREGVNVTKVRGVYPNGGVWEADVTDDAITAAEQRAMNARAAYRRGAESGQVLACPGRQCGRCDFAPSCPAADG